MLRFVLSITGHVIVHQGWWKRFPPINDTVLLVTAIALLVLTGWRIGPHFWVTTKVIAVFCYIGLGWFALNQRLAKGHRLVAFGMAAVAVGTIVFLAFNKPL
ncbi:MAG: SirB2 family protein [Gammaproteobacteria bacterium]|nr:SirB2 family protein [Gammaproteobacteria bacterium]